MNYALAIFAIQQIPRGWKSPLDILIVFNCGRILYTSSHTSSLFSGKQLLLKSNSSRFLSFLPIKEAEYGNTL
jgi:hypothetical protein